MSAIDDPAMVLRQVAGVLRGYVFRYGSEAQLHERIGDVLRDECARFMVVNEYHADCENRFDFWIPIGDEGGVVIEVKVDGSEGQALRQVQRYSALPEVRGVLLASTCRWARPMEAARALKGWTGKPVEIVRLLRQVW